MQALGQRFNGDPRLAYVDVGGYGNWGEGHNWPYEQQYQSGGSQETQQEISLASAQSVASCSWWRGG